MIWYFIAGAVIFAVGALFGSALTLTEKSNKKKDNDWKHG